MEVSRRTALAALGGAALLGHTQPRPKGYLVENTLHMFATDQAKFPFHKNAPYKPEGNSLDNYIAFVKEAHLDHTVLVQPCLLYTSLARDFFCNGSGDSGDRARRGFVGVVR